MFKKEVQAVQFIFSHRKFVRKICAILFIIALVSCSPNSPAFDPTASATQVNSLNPTPNQTENIQQNLSTTSAPSTPTAVPTSSPIITPVPLPVLINPINESLRQEADDWNAEFIHLNQENTGIWQLQKNNLTHPIALEIHDETIYMIDKGRVLSINVNHPSSPAVLLEPGLFIDDVLVLEPLDLGVTSNSLLVLDRAGDVYRFDLNTHSWQIDRYDRPVEESSGHYFVALDGFDPQEDVAVDEGKYAALLETNYKFTMTYGQISNSLWNLDEGRGVDLSVNGQDVFVLQRAMHDQTGTLSKYNNTRKIDSFSPLIEIENPRQVVAADSAVYILDQGGLRLRAIDPQNGSLLRIYQVPQQEIPSTFTITTSGDLVLGARDRIYFFNEPENIEVIEGEIGIDESQPHDPLYLATLLDYTVPIGGSNITFRDFQLPGAPRHYRLGVHQGLDFYWQPGTKVLAAADGIIVRADTSYTPPTAWELAQWWNESQERGYTSPETLDKYSGRQVWIEHEGGHISRYAHLSSVAPGINIGVAVTKGEEIGEVGNSGSPSSLESESADAHLHFELWIGDSYLGQFLRPIEVREWVEKIFSK